MPLSTPADGPNPLACEPVTRMASEEKSDSAMKLCLRPFAGSLYMFFLLFRTKKKVMINTLRTAQQQRLHLLAGNVQGS